MQVLVITDIQAKDLNKEKTPNFYFDQSIVLVFVGGNVVFKLNERPGKQQELDNLLRFDCIVSHSFFDELHTRESE
jgi:hypothetical protein